MPRINPKKSDKQAELEKELDALIESGASKIDGYKLPAGKQNRKTLFTLATYAAVSDRAEGILLMAQNYKPDPAFIILRSAQEGYLNLCYVLQTDNDARLLAMFHSLAEQDVRRVRLLDTYLKTLTTKSGVPEGLSSDAHDAIARLEKQRDQAQQELAKLEDSEFAAKSLPDLVERLRRYDAGSKAEGNDTHLELDYRMIYFFLSQHTHLGLSALANNLGETGETVDLNPKDPVSDCEIVLHSAYAILGDTLMLTLAQIGASTDGVLEQMKEVAKRLKPDTKSSASS